jgi:hypothetical protein
MSHLEQESTCCYPDIMRRGFLLSSRNITPAFAKKLLHEINHILDYLLVPMTNAKSQGFRVQVSGVSGER